MIEGLKLIDVPEPPPLEERIERHKVAILRYREDDSLENLRASHAANQSIWTAYFDLWVTQGPASRKKYGSDVQRSMEQCLEQMEYKIANNEYDHGRAKLMAGYRESADLHLRFIELLHKKGLQALSKEMDLREKELLAQFLERHKG